MNSKTIAIVLNTSWNIFNFRLNLIKAFQAAGWRVIAIAPQDAYTYKLKDFGIEHYDIQINSKGVNPFEDLKLIYDFLRLYQKARPDILLHYTIKPNIYGSIAAGILGIPVINNISGLGTVFIKESLITSVVKWLYRYSLHKSSKVFFQNSDDIHVFLANKLVAKEKCDLLPGSGIDFNKFIPIDHIKDNEQFVFLLIARMLWDKGIGEYVEAAKMIKLKYPYIEFQLLGSLDTANKTAISKEQMKQWTDAGVVTYLGITDNVQQYIKQADCIVLPSYREGTPRTLLESASMAKPIITTNVPGCKEVVTDGINGYLCKVQNSYDLASKMEIMLKLSNQERASMGLAGRKKIIKEFDEMIVIQKYLDTIQSIVT